MDTPRILVIEDEIVVAHMIKDILVEQGYIVEITSNPKKVTAAIDKFHPDILIMDITFDEELDGIELAGALTRQFDVPIVYLTSHSDEATFQRAMQVNPYGYMVKPANQRELISNITTALQRHQLEKKLKESETRYRMLVELAADAIFSVSIDGIILGANSRAETLTGYSREELAGKDLSELFSAEEMERLPLQYDRLRQGETVINERTITRKDGSLVSVEMNSVILPDNTFQSIHRNISERKKMDETERRANKLASIGMLAGGIAHDFNNILTIIMGNISLAKLTMQPAKENAPNDTYALLDEAEKASLRAKDLTQQLLTFSRGGAPVKENAYIDDIIRDSTEFVLHGSAISCTYSFEENLWPTQIDKGQISQVIQNLVLNAVQAMPSGGDIHITLANKTLPGHNEYTLAAGKYVYIEITDQGIGIPPEHLPSIFDPYYTTKKKGSGLGLAISYSIIKRHGGNISASSTPGKGSVFGLYLPASDKLIVKSTPPKAVSRKKASKKRILFMDDEKPLQVLAMKILTSAGHQVVTVSSGEEALKLYKDALKDNNAFDLVIMDLTVPGAMGGKELMSVLREYNPSARGIVSSGYSNDTILSDYHSYGFSGMIEKPFDTPRFLQTVEEVLSL